MLHQQIEAPYLVPGLTLSAAVITQSTNTHFRNAYVCAHTFNHAHTDTSIQPEKIATACARQRCLCWHDWCPQSHRPLLLFLHPIKHKSVDMDRDLSAQMECIQTCYTVLYTWRLQSSLCCKSISTCEQTICNQRKLLGSHIYQLVFQSRPLLAQLHIVHLKLKRNVQTRLSLITGNTLILINVDFSFLPRHYLIQPTATKCFVINSVW